MDERIDRGMGISLPDDFHFDEVSSQATVLEAEITLAPSLGPLAAFAGNWKGRGFNTIFRPDNTVTPTPLPKTPPDSDPNDNILELNLTADTLAFSASLGSVPNRGFVQGDIFLNGVSYLQTVNDITLGGPGVGIHVEPGLWMIVPSTTAPTEGPTLVRMASIPHGTTIVAQGTSTTTAGPPTIPPVSLAPTFTASGTIVSPPFRSLTATADDTPRIPQDLTPFITAGTITQALLNDPNSLLRSHIGSQKIISTTEISVATSPSTPLFGGGTGNIAFLLGDPAASGPNAQALQMSATFWIETVEHTILVPIFTPGQPPLRIAPDAPRVLGQPMPRFLVNPPIPITTPRRITVHSTQIQYSQTVVLNFNTLAWPHVSVSTLVPSAPIPIPPSVWD